jgi:hypothetical protein
MVDVRTPSIRHERKQEPLGTGRALVSVCSLIGMARPQVAHRMVGVFRSTGVRPTEVVTDGAASYPTAIDEKACGSIPSTFARRERCGARTRRCACRALANRASMLEGDLASLLGDGRANSCGD